MITPCCLQHIRNQFGTDRRPTLILFVLSRIWEIRDHGCDSAGACSLACVDHDEKFHETVVDIAWEGGLQDEYYLHPHLSENACGWECGDGTGGGEVPSSSLTLSPTVTLVS